MKGPRFSLILATVGRSAELERLFASLAAQSWRDFELIVIDQNPDARLAGPLALARRLGLDVRVLRQRRPNLAAARNAGVAAARGDWLAFPDDDCWYDPALLERVVEAALSGASRVASVDGVVARWAEQAAFTPGLPAGDRIELQWQRAQQFREVPVASITLFVRRRLFERIGGFDARLGIGQWYGAAEETDLVLRALRGGARLRYAPAALVHHAFVSPPPASPAACAAARRRARGTGALYAKHRLPAWVVLRGLAAPLVRPLLRGDFRAGLRLGLAVARGRLDGWLAWPQMKS